MYNSKPNTRPLMRERSDMEYIKIPIKNRQEGIDLAEKHFGSMMWEKMPSGYLYAYPYDNIFPIIITAPHKTEAETPDAEQP